ncbi:C2 calcium/lipid-binding domain CaLB [Penicillium chermesinum]|uniref:protein kinase C n=1 Tax=Penicillium chermesinum TaxID=63820 RepID=A0A9W9TX45_9EURO|nr:C2 calcium/lipid-binding domain CaLB [Penicillium chermesinum]KAJ5246218.1 C2 calcium/lipid-binding domain CaLB [Penicillium chermesinum]
MDGDEVIASVYRKIERERALIQAATNLRQSTDNPLVQQRADSNIRESRKNIAYLEEKMRELQVRRLEQEGGGSPNNQRDGYQGGPDGQPTGAPFADPRPYAPVPKARPNYTKLDLIKYDTQYLGPKIQLMLSQLEFKLSVEKQYKAGIEKMVRLYQDEGDRKSRADAEGRRIESNQKIQLLKQALKRYEDLHIDVESSDAADDESLSSPNMRKPLTGLLTMRIHQVSDVDHASGSRFSRGPETFVVVKVEDTIKARTKATRNDKWLDESFSIDIDKANEIELTVYDKSGDRPTPIGMLWIRLSDIAEEMRRKKIETELNTSGWVSADKMGESGTPRSDHMGSPVGSSHGSNFGSMGPQPGPQAQAGNSNAPPTVMIDSWFALEPSGRIQLSMSFAKQLKDRRPFDIGLNRQGAVRQKKEDVHEMQGHKFITQQFYNIMRCAFCGEFLKYAAGMQCADCKYTCHKKCYPEVVTKCISKANYETDPDEEKINHRIPHRWDGFSNLSANWCCHCGYLLPFGRKNAKKCTECGITCHAECTHLVPDFCGMSMGAANEILKTLIRAKNHNKSTSVSSGLKHHTLRPGGSSPLQDHAALSYPQKPTEGAYGAPPRKPSADAVIAATNAYNTPQSTSSGPLPIRDRQPIPPKSPPSTGLRTSSQSQAAVEATRPPVVPQQQQPQPPSHAPYNPGAYANVQQPPMQPPQPPQPVQQQVPPPNYGMPPPSLPPVQPVQKQQVAAPVKEEPQSKEKVRIGLDHFNFLAVLGKGNFGKVMLAETKTTRKLYAIKVLKKEFIIEHDEVESTKSEKRVFLIANKERHPFLLNLHACFQTETRVYFVMEYISGGDLMLHIQRGQFGLKRAQFYAAEVCLALKYFHENGVIYRDLKLDNILLTLDGHIKIADYGLCKENMWYGCTTGTFCGTPEFMAPEILLDKKYGRAVDWWAFGVLIYQMLLQQSPFRGEDEDEIYDAILADEALYPIHMPRDSVSILQKLLTREPELRLGSGPTDAQEVMSHAFFRNINWDDIYHKRCPPPMLPTISSPTDTSNFDQEFTSVTPVLTPVQSVLSQAMQEEFRGFSYTADFA